MQSVNISSAKGYLSSLLKNKEKLQEIIIERTGKPIAKILKYKPQIIQAGDFIPQLQENGFDLLDIQLQAYYNPV